MTPPASHPEWATFVRATAGPLVDLDAVRAETPAWLDDSRIPGYATS